MTKKNSKKRTHESRKCFCLDRMIGPSSAVSHRPAGKRPPTNLGNLPKINGQKQKIKATSIIRRSFSSLSLKFWNFIFTLNTLNPAIYQELNDQDFTQLTSNTGDARLGTGQWRHWASRGPNTWSWSHPLNLPPETSPVVVLSVLLQRDRSLGIFLWTIAALAWGN